VPSSGSVAMLIRSRELRTQRSVVLRHQYSRDAGFSPNKLCTQSTMHLTWLVVDLQCVRAGSSVQAEPYGDGHTNYHRHNRFAFHNHSVSSEMCRVRACVCVYFAHFSASHELPFIFINVFGTPPSVSPHYHNVYEKSCVTFCCVVDYERKRDPAVNTRVGTLIVATIYLQLIRNRYMFRSFTVLQSSHQHCVQPVASDVEVVGYL